MKSAVVSVALGWTLVPPAATVSRTPRVRYAPSLQLSPFARTEGLQFPPRVALGPVPSEGAALPGVLPLAARMHAAPAPEPSTQAGLLVALCGMGALIGYGI